jgi:hypothetical protein
MKMRSDLLKILTSFTSFKSGLQSLYKEILGRKSHQAIFWYPTAQINNDYGQALKK